MGISYRVVLLTSLRTGYLLGCLISAIINLKVKKCILDVYCHIFCNRPCVDSIISFMHFSGELPQENICTWKNLTAFNIAQNIISSSGLSTCFCNLANLEYFDVLYNNLSGSLPECLLSKQNIYRIDITANKITGKRL